MLQIREGGYQLFYSPGRDIAHVGEFFINYAIECINQWRQTKPDWWRAYCTVHHIIDLDVELGLKDFVESLRMELESGKAECLKDTPFSKLSEPLKLLLLYPFAKICLGAFLVGRKDITTLDRRELEAMEFYKRVSSVLHNKEGIWTDIKNLMRKIWFRIKALANYG